MPIQHEHQQNADIIFLEGRIDATSAPQVNQEIDAIIDAGQDGLLIHCGQLEYISSAGLRVLIIVAKKMAAAGRPIALCDLTEKVLEVFEISGFTAIFTIYPTQEEALNALGA